MNINQLKHELHTIIFEAETPAGKAFDLGLLAAIVLSVLVVLLESVHDINASNHQLFYVFEWIFTIMFTLEYVLRLWLVNKPRVYAWSFYGIIDLLSILPTYLALFVSGSQMLMTIRILRLLRIFRVLKLTRFLAESQALKLALLASRRKILVFLFAVLVITIIMGTIMYLVEGPDNGYTSIPTSIYWTIVTMTTVGFGDITPETALGKAIASFIMILGYGIIAVPTGIVTSELTREKKEKLNTISCPGCGTEGHEKSANYCFKCGAKLD